MWGFIRMDLIVRVIISNQPLNGFNSKNSQPLLSVTWKTLRGYTHLLIIVLKTGVFVIDCIA